MKITYSLWDSAVLLAVGLEANSGEEIQAVLADLHKVSINIVAHIRKVSI